MSYIEGIARIVLGYEISEPEAIRAEANIASLTKEHNTVFDLSHYVVTKVSELGEFKKAYFGWILAEARQYGGGIEVNLKALEGQASDMSTDLNIVALHVFGIERVDEPKIYLLADTSD